MSKKARNWLLAGVGVTLLVLGVPLIEQMIATASASAAAEKPATCSAHESSSSSTMSHPMVIAVGDNYLQVISTGNGSIGAVLYDSSFKLLGANENQASLTFSLPDGTKKTIAIAVPDAATLKAKTSGSCCAAGGTSQMPQSCPHSTAGSSDQKEASPAQK